VIYLLIVWIISVILLLSIPYSIALFYQRSFKRPTYPFVFLFSMLLYVASSIIYMFSSFFWGSLFFAVGGALVGGASFRLHQVMTRRLR